jgi:hypothetical protein
VLPPSVGSVVAEDRCGELELLPVVGCELACKIDGREVGSAEVELSSDDVDKRDKVDKASILVEPLLAATELSGPGEENGVDLNVLSTSGPAVLRDVAIVASLRLVVLGCSTEDDSDVALGVDALSDVASED